MSELEFKDVSVAFGGVQALKNVNISVGQSEIHGIIGPNGAGKTTILNVATGVYPLDSGDILIGSRSIRGLSTSQIAACGLARTFQTSQMFRGMTVLECVMTGLHMKLTAEPWSAALNFKKVLEEERRAAERARRVLDFVSMREFENYDSASLSFGQQKMVEIARALVSEPTVLLLDEPAVGLSALRVNELDQLLRRIRGERGVTIVMVEHVVQLVMGVCDHVTVLSSGVNIAEGTATEVRDNAVVQEAYLGKVIDVNR